MHLHVVGVMRGVARVLFCQVKHSATEWARTIARVRGMCCEVTVLLRVQGRVSVQGSRWTRKADFACPHELEGRLVSSSIRRRESTSMCSSISFERKSDTSDVTCWLLSSQNFQCQTRGRSSACFWDRPDVISPACTGKRGSAANQLLPVCSSRSEPPPVSAWTPKKRRRPLAAPKFDPKSKLGRWTLPSAYVPRTGGKIHGRQPNAVAAVGSIARLLGAAAPSGR